MPSTLPEPVYALIERNRDSVLLHTSRPDAENRRSFLFMHPEEILTAEIPQDIPTLFRDMGRVLASGKYVAGYFAYECAAHFELTTHVNGKTNAPLAWFGVFSSVYTFDHLKNCFEPDIPRELLRSSQPERSFTVSNLQLQIDKDAYNSKINSIHERIRAGETYQINLTDAYSFDFSGSPAAFYAALNESQAVPYSAFIHHGDQFILSLSPELFFRVNDRALVTCPMKGTAPRGRTLQEDLQISEWLKNDPKNRAENVMIVDLLRNDIGRLCEYGSVRAERLFAVEKYDTLFQMTSTVTGTLRPGVHPYEIFRSTFPCGSVTGAPKIRSMQIISELEHEPRGVYTGAIGYFAPDGDSTFNVAIRTVTLDGTRGKMGVGGGITIDSNAEEEFRECELKGAFLSNPGPSFSLFESLLWKGDYPFLGQHLDRMEQSALYFDFVFDRLRAQELLCKNAESLAQELRFKVRLSLARNGEMTIVNSVLMDRRADSAIVAIAPYKTSPSDRFLYHKTSNRKLYDECSQLAKSQGFDDVLFFNERGELTEGAISNVVIQVGAALYTPPLSCGVLPGVFRRHLLETNPAASERVLTLRDLVTADAIYICNAVRGMRRVKLETSLSIST